MESFFAGLATRWPAGREDYHWHVVADAGEIREHLTVPYRDLTGRGGLAPVAPEWAHVTVQHYAPLDEIPPASMVQVADEVRRQCTQLPPFRATVRRPEIWSNAVVCPVYPGPTLRQLWTIVRSATAGFPDCKWDPTPPYHPHLTIAYATARRADGEFREWLCDHDLPEPTIQVAALTLVSQKHDGHAITWRVLDVIPLGGTTK